MTMTKATTNAAPCRLHGAANAKHYWAQCPACDRFMRSLEKGLAESPENSYLLSADKRVSAHTNTMQGEHTMTAQNLNNRVNALITAFGLASVPALAEHLGIGRTDLYKALKEDREGIEPSDTAVLQAIAKAEEQVGDGGSDEGGMEGEDEQDTGATDGDGEDGEGNGADAEDDTPSEEEQVPAKQPKARKATAQAAKAKPAAKKVDASKPKAAKATTRTAQDDKVLTLPTEAGQTIATTSAKVLVVEADGTQHNRTVGPVTKLEKGGFTARVRLSNAIFNVASKDGKKWNVTGRHESKLETETKGRSAAKATTATKATGTATKGSAVRAAPKPTAKGKAASKR